MIFKISLVPTSDGNDGIGSVSELKEIYNLVEIKTTEADSARKKKKHSDPFDSSDSVELPIPIATRFFDWQQNEGCRYGHQRDRQVSGLQLYWFWYLRDKKRLSVKERCPFYGGVIRKERFGYRVVPEYYIGFGIFGTKSEILETNNMFLALIVFAS